MLEVPEEDFRALRPPRDAEQADNAAHRMPLEAVPVLQAARQVHSAEVAMAPMRTAVMAALAAAAGTVVPALIPTAVQTMTRAAAAAPAM